MALRQPPGSAWTSRTSSSVWSTRLVFHRESSATANSRITAIYQAIGVAVTWVDTYLDVPNVCVVKIVDEVGADGVNAPPDVVGMGFTNQESGGGTRVRLYDPIAQVSEGNQLDSAALLGAVIAHELGHLLLPSGSHIPEA